MSDSLDEYPGCWVTRDYDNKKWEDYALDSTKAEVLKLVKTIPLFHQVQRGGALGSDNRTLLTIRHVLVTLLHGEFEQLIMC